MATDPKANDKQDSGAPAGAEPPGSGPAPDQRRNRGRDSARGGKTGGDEQRREVADGDTSGGSPMDPQDEAFLKKSE
ncbi:MAG: hypothetical protein JWO70_3347 [Betaproteobacteria bacterium]|jgi:hypothetical protein|nr:hypothetical protein [Betaproteobacteria bacterium]